MILHTVTMTDTLAWSAGSKKTLDIDRNGYITHLNLLLKAVYDTASAGLSANEDGLAHLLSSVRIATAGRDFYNINDGRLGLFLARCQYQDAIRSDSLTTTVSQSDVTDYMQLPIHLGLQFYNTVDKTVVIPAVELPSLDLEVTWGSASALGTGYTVTSGTLYVTYTEILLQTGETRESIFPGGLYIPRMNPQAKTVSSAYSNLSLEVDVPVGDILAWILILVHGATTGKRCNNLVTEFGFKFPKEAQTPYRVSWLDETTLTRQRWALQHDYKGVVFFPLSLISGKEIGYDLSGYQVGDAKIAFTTSLSDTTDGDSAQSSGGTIYLLFYNVGL